MASFPNRCQHIKVNGTQCGSPALRRNKLCYFHKRHQEERIELNADRLKDDRRRRRNVAIDLPLLEDANSIQVSLMQIMRLLVAGQIDGKTAGLLLYALQTASGNLGRTSFEPYMHNVILDPGAVSKTPLGAHIWEDSDFIAGDDEPEEDDGEPIPFKTSQPVPKYPSGKVDWPELREQMNASIKKEVPAILAAQAARENRDRSG